LATATATTIAPKEVVMFETEVPQPGTTPDEPETPEEGDGNGDDGGDGGEES
jgi:hypothetical protein